jgi:hypothetical protein
MKDGASFIAFFYLTFQITRTWAPYHEAVKR